MTIAICIAVVLILLGIYARWVSLAPPEDIEPVEHEPHDDMRRWGGE